MMLTKDEVEQIIKYGAYKEGAHGTFSNVDTGRAADVILSKHNHIISEILTEYKYTIAELEAKVRVYETVIDKSNFKMAVVRAT